MVMTNKGFIRPAIASLLSATLLLVSAQTGLTGFVASGQNAPSSLASPIEVTASDNAYVSKIEVRWAAVRDASLYRVFRNTVSDPATAVSLGTTAAGSFTDTSCTPAQSYFYWVRAENGNIVGSLSAPDQGVRASGVIQGPVQPLNPPLEPAGNEVTASKAFLGKALFWDEQLSSTRTVACGTCHFATSGGSDARSFVSSLRSTNPGADGVFNTADDVFASPGVISNNNDGTFSWSSVYGFREQVTGRKARAYINAGYSNSLFWDGRATQVFSDPISGAVVLPSGAALESQVLGPPVSSAEMAHAGRNWNDVAARVAVSNPLALSPAIPTGLLQWIDGRSYPELFAEAFGSAEVTPARIAMAIATFERTLYSDRTPFDAAISQIGPLTQAEARGQGVFNQSSCNVCHAGALFSDNQFHNIGLRPATEDTGRFQVTGANNNIGEFRTPSLRNVELRGPYMHNGHFSTLEEVVEFYNRGGDFNAPNIPHNLIRPLNLTAQQKSDLVAFLKRPLTDPRVATAVAPFDRPTLYTESNRVPQIIGSGIAGSGSNVPQVLANEPPLMGNPSFTVALANALGAAPAVLVIDSVDPGEGSTIPRTGSFARIETQLSGSGAGQGYSSISLQIPNNSALIGSTFYGRWYVSDSNAAGGVAVSPAFKFTIFGDAGNATSSTNPIDDAQTFVTQHYRDFLNREPDPSGLAYWVEQINGNASNNPAPCAAGDTHCLLDRRLGASAAFFVENEFQLTGSYVYRMYATTLGRQPTYGEFSADRNQIVAGTSLAQSKAAFAEGWTQRPAFINKYGANPAPDVFVDALLTTLHGYDGVDLSSKRSAYISELQGGASRGQITREVAEEATLQTVEYNPSFVLMQYFGYLHRDADAGGYQFWLNVLNNKQPNNYRGMVCAFITAAEYQLRFASVVSHSNQDCSP
jgi:cytochrome c peroxidase